MSRPSIDFAAVNEAALMILPGLLHQWLPRGELRHHRYTALNPTRVDRNLGSFKINTRTGQWKDWATGDSGGDAISLFAYINGLSQYEAAIEVGRQVGVLQ